MNPPIKILISLVLCLSVFWIADFLYNKNISSKIYNTKNYYLTNQDINPRYDSESFLFPYHIYKLNWTISSKEFRIYSLTMLFIFSFTLIYLFSQAISIPWAFLFAISLVISPVFLIQMNWIGFPEHLVFLILGTLILLVYYRENIPKVTFHLIFSILLLLGLWSHFYQFMIAMFLILLVDAIIRKEYPIFIYLNFILSIAMANVLAEQLFIHHGVEQESDRASFAFGKSLKFWFDVHKVSLRHSIWNFFHGLVFLIGYLVLVKKDRLLTSIIIISALVTFFTYDTTRVFSNLFYPSFFYFLILRIESRDHDKLQLYGILLVLGFLLVFFTEPFYVWGSRIIYLR